MAYGLPVKGQANYDDELNNSIEAVKSQAELAQSTADAANTSANTAKTDATSAKATADQALDFVRTTSDDRVAEHVNDTASATSAALSASYARAGFEKQSAALTDGTDQAATLNAELATVPSGGTLRLPVGTVMVASALTIPDEVTVLGAGEGSAIAYTGIGTLVTLSSKTKVKFRQMRVHLAAADAIAFDVSGSFRCTWEGVIVEGQQVSTNGTTYQGQKGFVLRDNAGDNRIIDCDLNNLGTAVETSTITNYMVGCVIGSCWRGIVGGDPTGAAFNAGMSVESCTFVGEYGTSDTAVLVTGSAAEWWLSKVHIEKWDKAIEVGVAAGGARSFGLTDSFIAAKTTVLRLTSARQAHLADVTFSKESGDTPTDLVVDATGTPTGTAINLRKTQAFDFADADFPAEWMVYRRGTLRLPSALSGDVVTAGKGEFSPTSTTAVPIKGVAPSATTANLFEIYRGGTLYVSIDRFNVLRGPALSSSAYFQPGNGSTAGSKIYSGNGAPTIAGALNDLWVRTDGGAGTWLYRCSTAGDAGVAVWTAML